MKFNIIFELQLVNNHIMEYYIIFFVYKLKNIIKAHTIHNIKHSHSHSQIRLRRFRKSRFQVSIPHSKTQKNKILKTLQCNYKLHVEIIFI